MTDLDKPELTENILRAYAERQVESWDLKDLINFAIEELVNGYEQYYHDDIRAEIADMEWEDLYERDS